MKQNLIKILLIFSLVFCISSCQRWIADKFLTERPSDEFKEDLKDTTVEFRQGFYAGCEVGMASANNTFYKGFYRGNVTDGWKMTSSADYKSGWGFGFWYCYRKDWVKQKSTKIWGSTFGGLK